MGGLNTYAYVGNNPLRYIDPFGLLVTAIRAEFSNTFIVVQNRGDGSDGIEFLGLYDIENALCNFLCFFDNEWDRLIEEEKGCI